MKVALLHYTAPPVIGGVELVLDYQARELNAHAHSVMILAGRGEALTAANKRILIQPELDSQYAPNGQVAQALDQGQLPAEFKARQASLADFLVSTCAAADVLIVHNAFNLHFNLPLVAALHQLIEQAALPPLIAWCHDISRYVNPQSGNSLRFGFPWDLLRTYRPEVTYVAVSAQRQRALAASLACPPQSIAVISNGVDAPTLFGFSDLTRQFVEEFELLAADLIVLMPIRITQAKNIEFALRIIAALRATGLRVKLVVTGPPDPHASDNQAYWQQLQALCQELDLKQEVIFLYAGTAQRPGPLTIDTAVVAEFYRLCDAVLMTSRREGFGLPVLEAGLLGKPIFCTTMPVLEEIDARLVHLLDLTESPQQATQHFQDWACDDRTYHLRRKIRQSYTWPAIFQNAIQPLLAHIDSHAKQSS